MARSRAPKRGSQRGLPGPRKSTGYQPRLVRSLHAVGKYVDLRCRKDIGVVRTWGKGNVAQNLDTQHKQPRESSTWKLHACIKLRTNHAICSIIEKSAVVFGKRNRKSVLKSGQVVRTYETLPQVRNI